MEVLELRFVLDDHALQKRVVGIINHESTEALQEEQDEEERFSFLIVLPIDHKLGGRRLDAWISQAATMHE